MKKYNYVEIFYNNGDLYNNGKDNYAIFYYDNIIAGKKTLCKEKIVGDDAIKRKINSVFEGNIQDLVANGVVSYNTIRKNYSKAGYIPKPIVIDSLDISVPKKVNKNENKRLENNVPKISISRENPSPFHQKSISYQNMAKLSKHRETLKKALIITFVGVTAILAINEYNLIKDKKFNTNEFFKRVNGEKNISFVDNSIRNDYNKVITIIEKISNGESVSPEDIELIVHFFENIGISNNNQDRTFYVTNTLNLLQFNNSLEKDIMMHFENLNNQIYSNNGMYQNYDNQKAYNFLLFATNLIMGGDRNIINGDYVSKDAMYARGYLSFKSDRLSIDDYLRQCKINQNRLSAISSSKNKLLYAATSDEARIYQGMNALTKIYILVQTKSVLANNNFSFENIQDKPVWWVTSEFVYNKDMLLKEINNQIDDAIHVLYKEYTSNKNK